MSPRRGRAALGALVVLAMLAARASEAELDRTHAAFTALLARHVVLQDARAAASRVDYAALARERGALRDVLAQLARVTPAELGALPRADRLAFWINAYNAATLELILGEYPRHGSIRDYGSLLRGPWRQRFVRLLGETLTLDQIEHERVRPFGEPRAHFALNCASIGCPMLREEAYVGARLDAQLEEQTVRFLSDRSRNRFESGVLRVSKVFDWYAEDFPDGHPAKFLARYAALLGADPAALASGRVRLAFLPYDWRLNDVKTR